MSGFWFIDAWAVRDGVAFASRRPESSIDATNTVFLSVPSLEPIPVGRITTALHATRGCFQAGLFDLDGREIAFDNLTQVRDLIRRCYLASGIGPGGTAAPAPVGPVPEPGGAGGAYYEAAVSADIEFAGRRWLDEGNKAATALVSAFPGQLDRVGRLVKAFAEATIIEWERALDRRSAPEDPDTRRNRYRTMRGLYDWYATLALRGIWSSLYTMGRFILGNRLPLGGRMLNPFTRFDAFFREYDQDHSDHELLAMAPCPLRWSWDPHITRLSDKAFLALTDGSYFQSNPHVAELAPVLLAGLVSLPRTRNRALGVDTSLEFEDRLQDALMWLSRELPSVELPTPAERLLHEYAWSRLVSEH